MISKLLDKGIIELIGPFGLTESSYSASYNLTKLDTGVVTTYALYITLGLISILFILFFPVLFNVDFSQVGIEGASTPLNLFQEQGLKKTEYITGLVNMDQSIGLELLYTNYTYVIKIILLSIFSTFFILSL